MSDPRVTYFDENFQRNWAKGALPVLHSMGCTHLLPPGNIPYEPPMNVLIPLARLSYVRGSGELVEILQTVHPRPWTNWDEVGDTLDSIMRILCHDDFRLAHISAASDAIRAGGDVATHTKIIKKAVSNIKIKDALKEHERKPQRKAMVADMTRQLSYLRNHYFGLITAVIEAGAPPEISNQVESIFLGVAPRRVQ
ncbi:hypothetical protein SLS58_005059 [Diplodia intermedia]|uniref:Uncharacterized protein n=1 Tax=Diplodia intermedia TaxID=856260 RepID=A0ABR3TSD0_9PEZI